MSLIPSESANFPDLIGQHHGYRHPNAQRRSPRRAQRQAATPPELSKTREATVETPKPETAVPTPSVPSKAPEPTAIEPRNDPVESSRLLRMALRVPPQRSVAQMRAKIETQEETPTGPQAAMRPRTPTRGLVVAHATSALIVCEGQAKSAPPPRLPRFHWNKFARFITCELIAMSILILAMAVAFFHRSSDDSLGMYMDIVAIVTAIIAAIVPIIFYGLPKTLLRRER